MRPYARRNLEPKKRQIGREDARLLKLNCMEISEACDKWLKERGLPTSGPGWYKQRDEEIKRSEKE